MKRTTERIHRNFKLQKPVNDDLVKVAERTNRTQTAILHMALQAFFKTKEAK